MEQALVPVALAALKLPEAEVVGLEQLEDDAEGQQPARDGKHIEQVLGQLGPDPSAAVAAATEVDAQVDMPQVLQRRTAEEAGNAHRVGRAGDPGGDAVEGEGAGVEDGQALVRDGARHEEDARRPQVGLVHGEGLVVLSVRLVVAAATAAASARKDGYAVYDILCALEMPYREKPKSQSVILCPEHDGGVAEDYGRRQSADRGWYHCYVGWRAVQG
ncbi:hypothetical protein PspLS_04687 [Pyricularia sp. CBS 133598]|nr:hypothetical protein PspLS_04687 [Pyricularia sp. CBS 133598]